MAVKNISTRMQICGRGAGCHGGHSAVDKAAYISREKMYCEYDGMTYYPKYSEDLVHNEVMLPENAPEEYKDPSFLWNSVEMIESGCYYNSEEILWQRRVIKRLKGLMLRLPKNLTKR